MPSAADIAAEMDEGLKALFQAGLELSLQMQADAMGAETAEDRSMLALSFHRISRSVRQTAALRLKVAREAERSGREASAEVIRLDAVRLDKCRRHVKAEVASLIWSEAEDPERETYLTAELEDLLELESQDEDTFLAEPAPAQIRRLAHRIGLTTADPISDRHPRACPGDPDAPTVQNGPDGAAASPPDTSASMGPRDKPGDDGGDLTFDASG